MKGLIIGVAGSVLLVSGAALAAPLELPHQKVGLWQQSVSRDGTAMAAGSSQVCLDAAVEDKMSVFGQQMANKMCQSQKVAHNLDGSWSSDSVCMLGTGLKMSGHTVVTGNFNSKIVMTTTSTATGAPIASLNGKHETVITSTWLGPCKPGQRGGDMIMANGMKINMMDTLATPAKPAKPAH
jgi:hypothetical protein